MIVESDPKKNYDATIPINGYTVLKPGSSRVSVGIRNISCQCITIPAKTIIAKVAAAMWFLTPMLQTLKIMNSYNECMKPIPTLSQVIAMRLILNGPLGTTFNSGERAVIV